MPGSAAFAEHFRAYIGPRLRYSCRLHGLRVAAGEEGYNEAYRAIDALAIHLGASHLSPQLRTDLADTLHGWLGNTIDAAWDDYHAAADLADRVAGDLSRYFADFEVAYCPRFEPWP